MKKENSVDSSKKRYVLDSQAIIIYLNEESGYQKVNEVLDKGKFKKDTLYISLINLGEVIYYLIKQRGENEAKKILEKVKYLPINIVQIDEMLVWEAAKIKAQGGISYADSFVIATALIHKAPIVTGDKEFKKFEKMVKIEWI